MKTDDDVKIVKSEPSLIEKYWFFILVPIFAILAIANNFVPIFLILVVLLLIVGLIGIGINFPSSRKWVGFFIVFLILGSGFSELQKHFKLPIPLINIQQTTTFVEAPANIEDPELRNYEIAKMGFEENWFTKTMGGMYGLMAGSYLLSLLLQIGAAKKNFLFVLKHWSLEAVVFVVGALALFWAFKPNYAPDHETARAANIAFFIALIGPLIWSLLMQGLSWGIILANQSEGAVNNIYYSYFIGVVAYPLVAGIFSIFNLDLVDVYIMSDKLINTAITIQRWEEIKILGKFTGMFGPPAIVWAFTTVWMIFGGKIEED